MPRKKAPAAEAPRLVAYYRYSGGSRQTEQSIEGQRRDCEAYARAHGMTILREYVDRHISGKTDDRPAFQQLVADSAAHIFDAVICWKTDRLARNRYDSAVYKKKLRDNGVEILYAAESNISGAEGIIIEGLMEALAEYYSAELAEKARRGMRESALKGKALGSSRPLGLTVDADKHYIIEPTGAEAVRYIFEQYAAGLSSSSIVERLNAMGLRTSHGGPFNKSSINRIIQNEMYRGVYVSKKFDVRIEGAIPAIIDNDLWKRAQNMFERNRQSRTPHASRADYILSGKLYCGECGCLMKGVCGRSSGNGQMYHYYACPGRSIGRACTRKNIPQDELEAMVVNSVADLLLEPELLEQIADAIVELQQAEAARPDPGEAGRWKNPCPMSAARFRTSSLPLRTAPPAPPSLPALPIWSSRRARFPISSLPSPPKSLSPSPVTRFCSCCSSSVSPPRSAPRPTAAAWLIPLWITSSSPTPS